MRNMWDTEVVTTSLDVLVTSDSGEQKALHRLSRLPGVTVDFTRTKRVDSGRRLYHVMVCGQRCENDALKAVLGGQNQSEYHLTADMQFPSRTPVGGHDTSLIQQQRDGRAPKRPKKAPKKLVMPGRSLYWD